MDRILIVDDALDLGRLWQTALRTVAPELNIAVVPSAEEALLEANYHEIDLLLTDIRLPGMDGLELVGRIRRLHPEIKIILVTGMRDANYEKAVKALHADAFFEKPFELDILVEKVMSLLGLATDSRHPDVEESSKEESVMDTRLSDVLVSFREEVNALAVILLDAEGKIVELCGDIPAPDFEGVWVPSMLKVLQAGGAVSRLLGTNVPEKNILAFSGKIFDLMVLAPVAGYSLVSILKSGRTTLRPSLVFEATSVVQPELVKILLEMGIAPEPAQLTLVEAASLVEEDAFEAEVELEEDLENMLTQAVKQDADAFWDAAPDVNVKSNVNTLTFEEAMQRGLAPDKDNKAV